MLGPTGLTLRDWSGRGNHGTLTSMDSGTDWVASQGGYCLDFDGTDDRVAFGSLSETGLVSNMSVSIWVYILNTTPLQGIISQTGFSDEGWQIAVQNGSIRFPVYNLNTASVTANRWNHICCVRRGTGTATNEVWINGSLVTSSSASNRLSPTYNLVIGKLYGGTGAFYFAGQVRDARIYSRPLCPHEIKLLGASHGIAYEMAPRRKASVQVAASFNRRRRLLIGAGS
jgi:hypothetical protein